MTNTLRARIAAVGAGALVVAAAGATIATTATAARTKKARRPVVSTRKVPKLGTILVNSKGLTLYMFVPDKRRKVTCVKVCAVVWPPLKLPAHTKPLARRGVKQKLLGSDRNPAGGRVVTYHGWPLYTYVADKRPGMVTGQALDLNGGLWYVMSPSGKVIKKKVK
jgi:predicted lipoprotein with Yx(FWY)xxD motif